MFSEKGKQLLVINNYKFCINHVSKQNVVTWRCIKKTCVAKVYTEGETMNICEVSKSNLNHNHREETNLKRQEVNNSCKRKAEEDLLEKPAKIIRKEVARYTDENELTTKDISLIRRNIYNKKSKIYPALPKSREEIHTAVSSMVIKTNRNELFLHENDVENGMILFTCDTNIQCLR